MGQEEDSEGEANRTGLRQRHSPRQTVTGNRWRANSWLVEGQAGEEKQAGWTLGVYPANDIIVFRTVSPGSGEDTAVT